MSRYSSCLFLTNHELDQSKGISKKILSQVEAIEKLGLQTYLLSYKEDNNCQIALINNGFFYNLGNKRERLLYKNGLFFNRLVHFIKERQIDCVYIRYTQFADIYFLRFLHDVHLSCIKIYMEIPTYPYDGEFPNNGIKNVVFKWKDKILRQFFRFYVDRIVTFSTDKQIFGIPCLNISNAVDEKSIKLVSKTKRAENTIRMIGVANLNFWHGYDRMILGLKEYYSKPRKTKVVFTIVGRGNDTYYNKLVAMIHENQLEEYILMVGSKSGKELEEYFNASDVAIGSLGSHRKKIKETKTLKNVEYAMRGLPFVYAENNNDFDDKEYVLKVSSDETPIKIEEIVDFVDNNVFTPSLIRQSVLHLTWTNQMKIVFQSN